MSMLYLQQAGIIGDYHVMLATVSQTTDLGYLPPPPVLSKRRCLNTFFIVLFLIGRSGPAMCNNPER